MLNRVIHTQNDATSLILRLTLAIVIFPHGAEKVFGWFGGYGFSGTMGYFSSQGIPAVFGYLAILAEFAGSLGLLSGLLTRVAAFGIACDLMVAVLLVHLPNGFFMNWHGTLKGEGFEYHILAIGIAVAVMIRGGGMFSIDRKLTDQTV